jgi:hypothetical protein
MDEGTFATRLIESGCRRVMLDEAMTLAEKFLDSTSVHMINRGLKFEQNSIVFHMLCVRALILEKLRCELITRKLCPVTLHSLCSVFSMVYCSMSICIPL